MKLHVMASALAGTAACVCILSSCGPTEEAPDNTMVFSRFTDSARYKLEDTAKTFNTDEDILCRDSVDMLLPEKVYGHDTQALRDTIMLTAFDTIASPEQASRHFFDSAVSELGYSYHEVGDTIPGGESDGMVLIQGNVLNLSPRLLTYSVSRYVYYPGAAHGLTTTEYITYVLDQEKVLTLNDLFTPEGLEKLPTIINSRAKQLEPSIGPTDKITSLPSQGNFYISLNDVITFVYQPYEVASYAQGAIQISFYPTELTEYLSQSGLSYFQLN